MRFRFSNGWSGGPSSRYIMDTRGVGAIEFAVLAPVLIFMFVAMADLGFGIYDNMQVDAAAQYGSQYALVSGYDSGAITSAVQGSSNLSPLTVTPSTFSGCPGANGVTIELVNGFPCSDGSSAGTFARVSVSYTYSTIIPYPGLPSSFNLSSQSTVRLK